MNGPGGYGILSDIVGVREFRRGEAEQISGLRADGDTLTIDLVEPSADFLHRLSVPFFCPVPVGTPFVAGGAGPLVAYPHRTPRAVPSAGPYYIADHLNGEYTILKRNPNYTGPRPQGFDAIALREGIDPGVAVGLVEQGAWDGVTHVVDPLLVPTGPVAQKYGDVGASDAPGYAAMPFPLLGYQIFNASRPPFSDPDIRRAAALALDRDSIAALWGHAPTDQLLPPVVPGFVDREVYPLDGSRLEEARALMHGRTVTAVWGAARGNDRSRQEGEIIRADLSAIGIDVEIEEFPDPYVAALKGADIDMVGNGFDFFGYWDPASYLLNMLWFGTPAAWLPEGVAERLDELYAMTGSEERSAAALALADQLAAEDVPIAAILSGTTATLLAPSLGCVVLPPFGYGIDLAALCPS